jgi:predicted dienelactone hydrolase
MNKKRLVVFLVFVLALILGACAPVVPEPMEEVESPLVVEAQTNPEPIKETDPPLIVEETTPPEQTDEPEPALTFEFPDTELPLAELGPYSYSIFFDADYTDPQRNNKKVSAVIFYPSLDDQPDVRGAPFPLIISDTNIAYLFGSELASHGYVVAGIKNLTHSSSWTERILEQPLDHVFILNQLAEHPPEILAGIIDTDHVGVWGYSFGGFNSLAVSGARVDPDYYVDNCKNPEKIEKNYGKGMIGYFCGTYENWDAFVQNAGPELTTSEDGLWQPITDERILALMPMAAEGELLFGPKGLAVVDKAVLMVGGTNEGVMYEEFYRTFEELGTTQKTFISFVKRDHGMIDSPTIKGQLRHFAIAFFSHILKGYEDYGYYYSEAYVSQTEGLAYGWYEE